MMDAKPLDLDPQQNGSTKTARGSDTPDGGVRLLERACSRHHADLNSLRWAAPRGGQWTPPGP